MGINYAFTISGLFCLDLIFPLIFVLGILPCCMMGVTCSSSEWMGDNGPYGVSCACCCILETMPPSFPLHFAVEDLSCIRGVSSFIGVVDLFVLDGVPFVLEAFFLFVVCWEAFDELPGLGETLPSGLSSYFSPSVYGSGCCSCSCKPTNCRK
jgi:hypothetical protein